MATYRLDVSYDGTGFSGYARQDEQRTIQGDLEGALAVTLGAPVVTSVAGRTDAGVHARGQVVSFLSEDELDVDRLGRSLNGILGPAIAIFGVSRVGDDFDARHSATWRRYRYLIDTRTFHDPLTRHLSWHVGRRLDLESMRSASTAFIGEHDFSSFCRSVEGRSNRRRVNELALEEAEGLITIWMQANAFCHQMVRSVVGYLYDVGRGFSDGSLVEAVIEAGDRGAVVTVAPPHGLTLWSVGYA